MATDAPGAGPAHAPLAVPVAVAASPEPAKPRGKARAFLRALAVGLAIGAVQAASAAQNAGQNQASNAGAASANGGGYDDNSQAGDQPAADECASEDSFEARMACRQARLSGSSGWRDGTSFDMPIYNR